MVRTKSVSCREVKNDWVSFFTNETAQSKESDEPQCIEAKSIDYATVECEAEHGKAKKKTPLLALGKKEWYGTN